MTPIADILTGHAQGTYTTGRATALIEEHLADRATVRAFAAAAMQGRLATGVRPPTREALALECWADAVAMMACMPGGC